MNPEPEPPTAKTIAPAVRVGRIILGAFVGMFLGAVLAIILAALVVWRWRGDGDWLVGMWVLGSVGLFPVINGAVIGGFVAARMRSNAPEEPGAALLARRWRG